MVMMWANVVYANESMIMVLVSYVCEGRFSSALKAAEDALTSPSRTLFPTAFSTNHLFPLLGPPFLLFPAGSSPLSTGWPPWPSFHGGRRAYIVRGGQFAQVVEEPVRCPIELILGARIGVAGGKYVSVEDLRTQLEGEDHGAKEPHKLSLEIIFLSTTRRAILLRTVR